MVVRLRDKKTCEMIGNLINGHGTQFIPDFFFERDLHVLRKEDICIEVNEGCSNLEKIGIGYYIPFAFIECVKEWD